MNASIANSRQLASTFALDVIPLRFASSVEDLGRFSFRKLGRAARTAMHLARALYSNRPDVVYFTIAPKPQAFYRDCVYAAIVKLFDVPLVYHLHAQGVAAQLSSPWKRKLYEWVFDNAWVIHLSPALASDLGELVDAERLLFVENGIEDRYAGDVRSSDPPKILFLGHMREDKGPLVLLAALGELDARGVRFEATFAGAEGTRTCVDAFAADVERLGLGRRVRWIGPVFGPEKDELFRGHDIFAYPTKNDAFPLVVLEAMQWQLPIVATREGAIPQILGSDAGVLVAKDDARALADELELLLRAPDARQRLGAAARARYLALYTGEHFQARLEEALRTVIGGCVRR